jgi:hypothetical protein
MAHIQVQDQIHTMEFDQNTRKEVFENLTFQFPINEDQDFNNIVEGIDSD